MENKSYSPITVLFYTYSLYLKKKLSAPKCKLDDMMQIITIGISGSYTFFSVKKKVKPERNKTNEPTPSCRYKYKAVNTNGTRCEYFRFI